ncbi:MAG: hypothetical protein ACOY3Y_18305 [Acidobacteriota bacterium]
MAESSPGAVVRRAVAMVRPRLPELYWPFAVPLAAGTGAVALLQSLAFGDVLSSAFARQGEPMLPSALALAVVIVLTVLIRAVGYAAMLAAATDLATGSQFSTSSAWRFVLTPGRLATVLLASGMVLAGAVALVLPGVILAVLLIWTVPVMRIEGASGGRALRTAADRVLGVGFGPGVARPLADAAALAVGGGVVAYLVNALVQMPFVLGQQVILWRNASAGAEAAPGALLAGAVWIQVPAAVLGTLAEAAVMVYVCGALALRYADTRPAPGE